MTQFSLSPSALLDAVPAGGCLAALDPLVALMILGALALIGLAYLFSLALIWCCAHHLAPVLTKNATALGAIFLVFGSLLVCSILQSREQARQLRCGRNLQELGFGLHDQMNLHPEKSDRQQFDAQAWSQFVQGDFARQAGITSSVP